MIDPDRIKGALLGAAVGDALGMPVEGLSHQNVRTYYKGIKGYRADEHRRDLGAGQWTGRTQRTFALAHVLAEAAPHATVRPRYAEALAPIDLRRPPTPGRGAGGTIAAVTPLAVWWSREGRTDEEIAELVGSAFEAEADGAVLAAAVGQAVALRGLFASAPADLDGPTFFDAVTAATARAERTLGLSSSVSDRLRLLAGHLGAFPLDLQDLCDGTGPAADEAWPFAVAMLARNPTLLEATLLPAINVGGDAPTVGACLGALLGALHGWAAFPDDWREGLEDRARLEAAADALVAALPPRFAAQ